MAFGSIETLTCALCGATATADLWDLDRAGWDWFKGYRPRRTEICPTCYRERRPERDRLFEATRQKPTQPYEG